MTRTLALSIAIAFVSIASTIAYFKHNPEIVVEHREVPIYLEIETEKQLEYEFSNEDLEWLTKNIYFEAGNQSLAGKILVGRVTVNRVHNDRFPPTIKEVVTQGELTQSWKDPEVEVPKKYRCQFSWWCDGKPEVVPDPKSNPIDGHQWEISKNVAERILRYNAFAGFAEGATHYHAKYASPSWRNNKNMTYLGIIDDHLYYRED